MPTVEDIKRIAEIEFVDIVKDTSQNDHSIMLHRTLLWPHLFRYHRAFMEFVRNKLK